MGLACSVFTNNVYESYALASNALKSEKINWGTHSGGGFTYYASNKFAFYLDFESYQGTSKGTTAAKTYSSLNSVTNFGFKYNFKKR